MLWVGKSLRRRLGDLPAQRSSSGPGGYRGGNTERMGARATAVVVVVVVVAGGHWLGACGAG